MMKRTNTPVLRVGAAKTEMVITDDFFPYKSFRGRYYTGVHDPIYIRSLYIESQGEAALLLSFELGDLGEIQRWQEHISEATGVKKEHIFLSVTHNHEAPHVSDDFNQIVVDVEKSDAFAAQVWQLASQSAAEAKASAIKAYARFGEGKCDVNINRNLIVDGRSVMAPNPHGESDKIVSVLSFDDETGANIATVVNYPVHGVVMFDSVQKDGGMLTSGDLPGAVSRMVEERLGEQATVLFTSGAAGDQIPRYMSHRIVHDGAGGTYRVDAKEAGWVLLDVQAENLADEVMRVRSQSSDVGNTVALGAAQMTKAVAGQKKSEKPFAIAEDYRYEDGVAIDMPLGVLMIGPIALVCIPGEPVASIGKKLKAALPISQIVLVTHCNGSLSYMADEYGYEHYSFEAVVSHFKRGAALPALIEGATELIKRLQKES